MPEAESNIKPPETTTEQDAFHDSSPNFEDYEMSPYEGEVVISGISCRLPESENIQEFRDNLMNGVDMITEDDRRWKPGRALLICNLFTSEFLMSVLLSLYFDISIVANWDVS